MTRAAQGDKDGRCQRPHLLVGHARYAPTGTTSINESARQLPSANPDNRSWLLLLQRTT